MEPIIGLIKFEQIRSLDHILKQEKTLPLQIPHFFVALQYLLAK